MLKKALLSVRSYNIRFITLVCLSAYVQKIVDVKHFTFFILATFLTFFNVFLIF